jgi:hypothetical protein
MQAARSLRGEEVYRILWPADALKAIRGGKAVWKPAKDGLLRAVVRRQGGEIVHHLPLKRIHFGQLGPLTQLAMQSMLAEVTARLETIDEKITAVQRGQIADRMGLLLGAEMQACEALRATGPDRAALMRQAITPLNTFRGQALENARAALEALNLERPWALSTKYLPGCDSPADGVRKQMSFVQEHVLGAIRATRLLGALYLELGQPGSAQESLHVLAATAHGFLPKGREAALWVPYDSVNPPEALWDALERLALVEAPKAHKLLSDENWSLEIEANGYELTSREDGSL